MGVTNIPLKLRAVSSETAPQQSSRTRKPPKRPPKKWWKILFATNQRTHMQLMPQKTQTTFTRIVIFFDVFFLIKWYYYRSPHFFNHCRVLFFGCFQPWICSSKRLFRCKARWFFSPARCVRDWTRVKFQATETSLQLTTIAPVVKGHPGGLLIVSCRERTSYHFHVLLNLFLCER